MNTKYNEIKINRLNYMLTFLRFSYAFPFSFSFFAISISFDLSSSIVLNFSSFYIFLQIKIFFSIVMLI